MFARGRVPWEPITESAFRRIMPEQVLRLDGEMFSRCEAHGVSPGRLPCERDDHRGGPPTREAVFVVARSAGTVPIYDDVEEEFGAGRGDRDGVLREWDLIGGELAWAVRRLPRAAAPREPDAPPA